MPEIMSCSAYATTASTGRQVVRVPLNGLGSSTPIGGPLRREAFNVVPETTALLSSCEGNLVISKFGNIFCVSGVEGGYGRIYKYYRGYKCLLIDADPSGGSSLPLKGDTVSGSTGEGVLAEDYVSGDDFIVIQETTSGFVDGETVTITGPSSGSNTADLIGSGSVVENSGEWGAVYTGTRALLSSSPCSGLIPFTNGEGRSSIGCAFHTSVVNEKFVSVVYDVVNDRWFEATVTGTSLNILDSCIWSSARGSVYVVGREGSGNTLSTAVYNFNSNSYGEANFATGTGNYTAGQSIDWEGLQVYSRVNAPNSIELHSISTPGLNLLASNWGSDDWAGSYGPTNIPGAFVGGDNALYVLARQNQHFTVARFHQEDGNLILDIRGSVNTSDYTYLRQILLPDALDVINSTQNVHVSTILDLQTDPDNPTWRYLFRTSNTGGYAELTWGGWTDLDSGSVATWDGTTTVTFGSDVSSELAVNDYIRHNTTNRAFIVSAISMDGTEVTIINESTDPTGAVIANSIPSTNSAVSVLEQMNLVADYTDGGVLQGHPGVQIMDGGGERYWSEDQLTIDDYRIVSTGSGLRYEFTLKSGVSPSETRNVKLVYTNPSDSSVYGTGTLSSASGSIVGNEVQGCVADGSTVHYLVWNASADGFTSSTEALKIRLVAS